MPDPDSSPDDPFIGEGPDHAADGSRIRRGGCTCGAVRFELRGEPLKVGLCHCTKCRKATGSTFLAYADWPPSAFTATGEAREYDGRSFCAACGARVFHLSQDRIEIDLGALDDAPFDLVPTREGWTIRREPWLAPIPGAAQFDRDPD
jgi:hypothetical protein